MTPAVRAKWVKRRRWVTAVALALLGLLLLDYLAYPFLARPGGPTRNQAENGLWLRYTWYFGQKSDAHVQLLAQRLQAEQVRYAYFHVRSITKSGTLKFHNPDAARRLVSVLHRQAPAVKLLAWVYAGNVEGEGAVDLSKPDVRRAMVGEARWLVTTCGFDGIQWDYEICPDGDRHFLELLQETRTALPPGKTLSAAVPMWLPSPLRRFGWSDDYFVHVSEACDQMAVMCYDTGCYLPRGYVALVRQQVVHVSAAVARGNPRCRVLFGLPTYAWGGLSHHAYAENIRMALIGVREGLADPRACPAVVAGVAPFADYTTQPSEWETYENWWLRP